jgi:hypothetical protein
LPAGVEPFAQIDGVCKRQPPAIRISGVVKK